jgi:hypothetical protein
LCWITRVAVGKDLAGRGTRCRTHALGLGPAALQSAELLEHLVQEHDQVAGLQQPIQRFRVFDEGRRVRDVEIDGTHLAIPA